MPKKKRRIETYCYNKAELEKRVKDFAGYKLNKAQLMILYPWMTSNYIKHAISPRAKYRMPCDYHGNKPFFIVNQVDAYLNNPKAQEDYFKKERESKKGKISKIS